MGFRLNSAPRGEYMPSTMVARFIQFVARNWEAGQLDAMGERVETLLDEVRRVNRQCQEMAGQYQVMRFHLGVLADRRERVKELEAQLEKAHARNQ